MWFVSSGSAHGRTLSAITTVVVSARPNGWLVRLIFYTSGTGNVNHDCHFRGRNIHAARMSAVDVECCLARGSDNRD
ncbi:hypothetical protein Y032_1063g3523 [Ancylostoma ceylanicum]|uniref:Uncharacterized protein n=1 Tax=Ancylostoma ceylanicum TaxID=53326 RepID=A0A016W6D5_9BILA|nr:hypothetical protein Y032_1063g3523 [Ancylostoma ceylanicum]